MRRLFFPALLAVTAVACSGSSEDRDKPAKEKADKGAAGAVRIGSLRAETPKDWKEEQTRSSMRAHQFRLPGDGGAEVVVFQGIRGTAKQNVDRWEKQFTPPEGKKRAEAIKVTEMKVGSYPALYFDAEGTYASGMGSSAGPEKDYRMLAIAIEVPDRPVQIVLRGPARTVEKHKKQFDDWLKSFQ